jgi:Ca2+/H+ antiporter
MNALLKELRSNPLLWLLVLVPVVLVAHKLKPDAHTMLFVLSVLAIIPLAALMPRNRWRPKPGMASAACSTLPLAI